MTIGNTCYPVLPDAKTGLAACTHLKND